jgi:hypothetical protein
MIQLSIGCYCTELKVSPANWKTNKSTIKQDWFVYYRFHYPAQKHLPRLQGREACQVKGYECIS